MYRNRLPTDLENSWNFVDLEDSWNFMLDVKFSHDKLIYAGFDTVVAVLCRSYFVL